MPDVKYPTLVKALKRLVNPSPLDYLPDDPEPRDPGEALRGADLKKAREKRSFTEMVLGGEHQDRHWNPYDTSQLKESVGEEYSPIAESLLNAITSGAEALVALRPRPLRQAPAGRTMPKALKERLPDNSYLAKQFEEALSSNRFAHNWKYKKGGYSSETHELHLRPRKPAGAKRFPEGEGAWYDPAIAEVVDYKPGDRYSAQLNLKPGYVSDINEIARPSDGILFRGMSGEEFSAIKKGGSIKSKGLYNLGKEQEGLTFYSTMPDQAAHYASGFAPWTKTPSSTQKAYMIAVKNPNRPGTKRVAGTEIGVPGEISAKDIIAIYEGTPYYFKPGLVEAYSEFGGPFSEGSRFSPTTSVAWRKVSLDPEPGASGEQRPLVQALVRNRE